MLHVIVHSEDGRELGQFDLGSAARTPGRVLVGRAPDCDLRIAHAMVSRHHCAMVRDEDGDWFIHDLGSTHGTMLDGQRISTGQLAPGSTVKVGPAILRFVAVPAHVVPDPSNPAGPATP